MTTAPMPDDDLRLLEQACAWLAKMQSGEVSAADSQSLADWRAAAPAHERAWQRAQAVWQGLEPLRGRQIPGAEPLSQERGRQAVAEAGSGLRQMPRAPNRHRRQRYTLGLAACALLALTVVTFYPPLLWQADYVTGKGEQRRVVLADGSRAILNADSALAIRFDKLQRRVELLRGEAFFEVAKDGQRPFLAATDAGEVRAVGTAFGVRRSAAQTQVELVEGRVEIRAGGLVNPLAAGQTAAIAAGRISVAPGRAENMAVWRDGYLQFDGVPLAEAVERINSYRPGKVLLLNSAWADKRISGLFRLDALDQAVAGLGSAVPGLRIVQLTRYLVVLR
ncbi:iron dicitrate transport regulator FecR [Methylomonas koyamae]|uniref:Iron dicitrate transport regulator FecR n=1 Tax=Methylomonas koyamae TaxID=702114 RepID=A0A177NKM8_9GAMM|nr:FecR family protein [Methylomonas koyamae]OAI18124.1 iron dicitrate transport regulator FecR [Methylomonas koyamae]